MKRSAFLRPYCTHIGEKFSSSTTECFMIHITFVVPFMLWQTFSLYTISNQNFLSSHSEMLPAEMPNQEYVHTDIPRNPQNAQQCNTYVQHSWAAGIAQLVQRTPMGWTVWGSNPGGVKIFSLEVHPPSCHGSKATVAWHWPPTILER